MSGRGVDLQDQVPRKLRYQLRRPDTEFFPPCEHDSMWRARLNDAEEDAEKTTVRRIHLSELLDELERLDRVHRAG